MQRSVIAGTVAIVCGACAISTAFAQDAKPVARISAASALVSPVVALVAPPTVASANSAASAMPDVPSATAPVSPITADILAKIPRQVFSIDGHPGDVVNFLILGNKQDVRKAIGAAGWSRIACTKLGAVWHDLFNALDLRGYRGLPMSKLYLFGRQQDVSYSNAKTPFSWWGRHHFRIWQAPFEVDGQTLWIGAATRDVGLRWQETHPHLIHKIDPNVDSERQYVSKSLNHTGRFEVLGYVMPSDARTTAHTTTGEQFYTDGRVLVMKVVAKNSVKSAVETPLQ
jgi:LssY C-terminus